MVTHRTGAHRAGQPKGETRAARHGLPRRGRRSALAFLTDARGVFGPLGVTGIRTFVDPQGSNRVGVLMDIPDMDAVMALMDSDVGIDAMATDGVHADTLTILVAS
jgi:hypothetical protein